MSYKYITENNLYEKQNYMYSEYRGIDFLRDYVDIRHNYAPNNTFGDDTLSVDCFPKARSDLKMLLKYLIDGRMEQEIKDLLNDYTKSFEVRKRIYVKYEEGNFKPEQLAGFEEYDNYLAFAECLFLAYIETRKLKYFNCLLKVDDTLLSVYDKLNQIQKSCLAKIIDQEMYCFYDLVKENLTSEERL